MGFRFRKSIGKGPLRINISKSGVGGSVGVKGCRFTKTSNGKTRTTLSIPGTGISHVSENGGKKKSSLYPNSRNSGYDYRTPKLLSVFLGIVGWFMIVVGLLLSLTVSPICLIFVAIGVIELFFSRSNKKKAKVIQNEREVFYNEHNKEVFCSRNGKKFHSPECRYAKGLPKVLAADAILAGKEACSICNPEAN